METENSVDKENPIKMYPFALCKKQKSIPENKDNL